MKTYQLMSLCRRRRYISTRIILLHRLLRIVEAGLPNKFLDERLKQLLGIKLFIQEQFVKNNDLTTTIITLTHTQGAFFILLGGSFVGLLILIGEICMAKCCSKY